MGLREAFRDKTRDKICAGLQAIEIEAQMAERGRPEEVIGRFLRRESLGLIDIPEGPISWISVLKYSDVESTARTYYVCYGVPDPRLGANFEGVIISSHRKKTFPLFGKVVDMHWKGKDSGLGIIDRLKSDILIKHAIMKSYDVEIRAHGDHGLWTISTKTRKPLSEELWNCYQAIARHLLAEMPDKRIPTLRKRKKEITARKCKSCGFEIPAGENICPNCMVLN